MKLIARFVLLGIGLACAGTAYAQTGDEKPVDEVIARINAGVILRSTYESAQKEYLEELKRQGLSGGELEKKFNEVKPRILDPIGRDEFKRHQVERLVQDPVNRTVRA